MTLPVFKDFDPANPFPITGETKTIDANGQLVLDYLPLRTDEVAKRVTITGYTEVTYIGGTPPTLQVTEFYIDYRHLSDYTEAKGIVQFNTSKAGQTVTVNYYGIGQNLWAKWLNEIKTHVDNSQIHAGAATAIKFALIF